MKEIVGARIGTTITNKLDIIILALETGQLTEWLDRERMEFMSACDLGVNWKKMAKGPVLFYLDDERRPTSRKVTQPTNKPCND